MDSFSFSSLLACDTYASSQDCNADFDIRAESTTSLDADQAKGSGNDVSIEIIESAKPVNSPVRLSAIVTLAAGGELHPGNYSNGFEILVISGDLISKTENNIHTVETEQYLRIPFGQQATFTSAGGCILLTKLGQMSDTDHEPRHISTDDDNLWLPGPADGTEVLPLHLHDTKSVLLIRWKEPAYFKPQLDPMGEEMFVVKGTLHDAYGSYQRGSWIRNPIPAWQGWGGHPDTLVYYKNGHFPKP